MSIKQAIEALESCTPGDYSTGHVIHPSYDEDKVNAALAALSSMPAEPYAYAVYFPDQPTEELVHDLDELLEDMTNREHTITELFATPPSAAQPEAVSIKVLEIALDRLQYISDFFCDEAGGDDWHLKGVAIDALEEIQRVRASAPTPEPMSAPTAEPVCDGCGKTIPEHDRLLRCSPPATPPSAATPEPSDAKPSFREPTWKDEPPDWCSPKEEEIWQAGYDSAMASARSMNRSIQSGPVMHAPSGFTFDTVLAAANPEDLVSLTPPEPSDAERYRWLRETHPIEWPITLYADAMLAPDYFDAAIDAAIRATKGGKL